ncbi:MAG: tyrosine-type recombinase/integrase [Candidatus Competibacteraceae bacterium]|nr:tyrosine-type recombinase/integrase [Candidatus Competibacteraceae bacterium]
MSDNHNNNHNNRNQLILARTNPALTQTVTVADYVQAATAENTRKAYQEDLQRFLAWGGNLPCQPEQLADYLANHGETHAPASLARWAVSVGRAHTSLGLENPAKTDLVRTVLRGIRHRRGIAQRQVAPTLRDDLLQIVRVLGDSPRDVRDRALLLIGFAGALRRSELVALTTADVQFSEPGLTLTVRRSKTDQEGQGRSIGIPFARGSVCPVKALRAWIEQFIGSATDNSPIPLFRPINKHGQIGRKALTGHAVAVIVKQRSAAVGLSAELYSGHSLRAGFCTSAALNGAPHWQIKKISGHKTNAILDRYIRDARLFSDNPLAGLF